jgi:hypothetical protein
MSAYPFRHSAACSYDTHRKPGLRYDEDNNKRDPQVLTFASRLRLGPFIIAATLTLPCSSTSPWVAGFETRGGSACVAGGNRVDCGEVDGGCLERLKGSIREDCSGIKAGAERRCNYWIAQVIRMSSISEVRWRRDDGGGEEEESGIRRAPKIETQGDQEAIRVPTGIGNEVMSRILRFWVPVPPASLQLCNPLYLNRIHLFECLAQ